MDGENGEKRKKKKKKYTTSIVVVSDVFMCVLYRDSLIHELA